MGDEGLGASSEEPKDQQLSAQAAFGKRHRSKKGQGQPSTTGFKYLIQASCPSPRYSNMYLRHGPNTCTFSAAS